MCNPNQCPYYNNALMHNSDNMYNMYTMHPYPYYFNPAMYNLNAAGQYASQPMPFNVYAEDDVPINLKDYGPEPFVINIEEATKQNDTFRTALWTGKHLQLTLMSIDVGGEIGLEIHPNTDQFIRIEEGQGVVRMGDSQNNLDFQARVYDDFIFIIPAGKWHNLINTGNKPIKLYSIYAPPQHPFGTVHETKAEAEAAEENHA